MVVLRKAILSIFLFFLTAVVLWSVNEATAGKVREFLHNIGLQSNGQIQNRTSKPLWVLISKNRNTRAFILAPHRKSPDSLDIDAVRTLDGSSIKNQKMWYKIMDGSKANVVNGPNGLEIECILCYPDRLQEFTYVNYYKTANWGVPL